MDSIQQTIIDTTSVSVQSVSGSINVWMVVAIIELVVIIGLMLSRNTKNSQKAELKRKVLVEGDVDFANVVNSSFNSEKLYKELIVIIHPDRFAPDEARMAIANELSTQITKNRHDIKRLEALRDEAFSKLNINI